MQHSGIISLFARLLDRLPPQAFQRLGALMGLIIYAADRPHRRIVKRNLRFAYPSASTAHIRNTARGVFQNLCVALLEMLQMTCWSPQELLKNVTVEGEQHMFNALAAGRGAIVISAHIGNWEIALAYASIYLDLPITAIVKRMRFDPLDRWLNGMRTRFGTRIRYKQQALTEMMDVMRRKEVLAVLIDQSKRSEGVPVQFFGSRVITTSVAALLARRYRCPVVAVFCVRASGGRLTIRVEPPLELVRSKDMRTDLQRNTQIMTDVVERVVREYPQQWFWFHKRWKKFYPHLYPEYFRRRARRKAREHRRLLSRRDRIG